jgi:peptide/nickel transport system substrate-binding protein
MCPQSQCAPLRRGPGRSEGYGLRQLGGGFHVTDRSERRRARSALAAITFAVALVAAACGGSGDETGDGDATSDTAPPLGTDVTLPAGEPQTGGTLTYGLEAESDGYDPTSNRFAPAGTMVGLAIYDPLAAFDVDAQPQPYLAESMTPSADNRTWTITARPDITFHNGEPLDGEAMRIFFEDLRSDALVGIAFKNIDTVAVDPADPLAVVLTMKEPWATFPVFLTGQGGMVTAPAMSTDAESGRNPIGTGPFKLDNWVPDNTISLSKNADYWRTDDNGVQLPYLDAVEFKPIPDFTARDASLSAGDLSMIHITNSQSIKKFQEQAANGQVQIVLDRSEREEGFIMLNTAVPPLDDLRVRQALAHATNREQINTVVNDGLRELGDGVFSQDSPWRVDDNPFPEYDPVRAQELVAEYEAEVGPIQFELENGGTDDRVINLVKEQWAAVGIDVTVSNVEQSTFILNAALGDYQAHDWRQFGALDPDYDYIWWTSENAADPGGIALNFARNKNPEIDAALKEGRASTDLEVRKEAYAKVQRLINEDLPYIFYDRAQWAVVADNTVRGITNGSLPDGQESFAMGGPGGFGGITRLTQTWLQP